MSVSGTETYMNMEGGRRKGYSMKDGVYEGLETVYTNPMKRTEGHSPGDYTERWSSPDGSYLVLGYRNYVHVSKVQYNGRTGCSMVESFEGVSTRPYRNGGDNLRVSNGRLNIPRPPVVPVYHSHSATTSYGSNHGYHTVSMHTAQHMSIDAGGSVVNMTMGADGAQHITVQPSQRLSGTVYASPPHRAAGSNTSVRVMDDSKQAIRKGDDGIRVVPVDENHGIRVVPVAETTSDAESPSLPPQTARKPHVPQTVSSNDGRASAGKTLLDKPLQALELRDVNEKDVASNAPVHHDSIKPEDKKVTDDDAIEPKPEEQEKAVASEELAVSNVPVDVETAQPEETIAIQPRVEQAAQKVDNTEASVYSQTMKDGGSEDKPTDQEATAATTKDAPVQVLSKATVETTEVNAAPQAPFPVASPEDEVPPVAAPLAANAPEKSNRRKQLRSPFTRAIAWAKSLYKSHVKN